MRTDAGVAFAYQLLRIGIEDLNTGQFLAHDTHQMMVLRLGGLYLECKSKEIAQGEQQKREFRAHALILHHLKLPAEKFRYSIV